MSRLSATVLFIIVDSEVADITVTSPSGLNSSAAESSSSRASLAADEDDEGAAPASASAPSP